MTRKKRTKITLATEEVVIIKRSEAKWIRWCPACRADVETVTTRQAAAIAKVTTGTVSSWLKTKRVHPIETPDGSIVVCADSLRRL